jgi:hypothetical protein
MSQYFNKTPKYEISRKTNVTILKLSCYLRTDRCTDGHSRKLFAGNVPDKSLAPWNRIDVEKLIVSWLVNKFFGLYRTSGFISVYLLAMRPYPEPLDSCPHLIPLGLILILTSHIRQMAFHCTLSGQNMVAFFMSSYVLYAPPISPSLVLSLQ